MKIIRVLHFTFGDELYTRTAPSSWILLEPQAPGSHWRADPSLHGTHGLVPWQFSNMSPQLSGPAFISSMGPSSACTSNSSTAPWQDELKTAMSWPWREAGHPQFRYQKEVKPVDVSIPATKDITCIDLPDARSDLPQEAVVCSPYRSMGYILRFSETSLHTAIMQAFHQF